MLLEGLSVVQAQPHEGWQALHHRAALISVLKQCQAMSRTLHSALALTAGQLPLQGLMQPRL